MEIDRERKIEREKERDREREREREMYTTRAPLRRPASAGAD